MASYQKRFMAEEIREIRRQAARGACSDAIAWWHNTAYQTIWRILTHRTYRWVQDNVEKS